MKKTILFEKTGKNLIKCLACSWYCNIGNGRTGVCHTRYNKGGSLYSLVYGKSAGLHLDPVEKKPLYHFLPGCRLLSFGTLGCNFGCLFCQNWEISQITKTRNSEEGLIDIIDKNSTPIRPEEVVEIALEQKAAGIAYTYNEPAIWAEYAHDTAKIARKNGLKNVFVSNGFESVETFNYMKNYLDAINIDLKSFSNEFYTHICKSKITPVKENIKKYFRSGIETEVTTLVIPGKNDSDEELTSIARFLKSISEDVPWHISAFYPAYKMINISPTGTEKLLTAYHIGKKEGLKYVYLGNVNDDERSSTRCPKCKELLISRSGFYAGIRKINLKKDRCAKCGEKIYGFWN